nr:SDR family NAD(P)-dependent oxidoreductase [Novosphingobium sp. SG720]
MRFDDDVVIITGAGRGLGRAYALAFAERGAAVVVNDIGQEPDATGRQRPVADQVVAEIHGRGGRALADHRSITEPGNAEAVVAAASAAFGKVTVLVNNAGIIDFAPIAQLGDAAWRKMQSVTVDGAFYMCRAVLPSMLAQGHGRIVNTTSNAGFGGAATLGHYGAAKLAVAGLTRCLAHEVAGTGVTVNAVAPMAITRMNRDAFFGGKEVGSSQSENEQATDWRADLRAGRIPMGPPEAVAPTVLWLAHASTTTNGEIFSSSSGKVARIGFAVGQGWFDPNHAPEDLRDHAATIRTLGDFLDITATTDELALIPPLFAT